MKIIKFLALVLVAVLSISRLAKADPAFYCDTTTASGDVDAWDFTFSGTDLNSATVEIEHNLSHTSPEPQLPPGQMAPFPGIQAGDFFKHLFQQTLIVQTANSTAVDVQVIFKDGSSLNFKRTSGVGDDAKYSGAFDSKDPRVGHLNVSNCIFRNLEVGMTVRN